MRKSGRIWIGGTGLAVLGLLCWLIFRTPPPDATPAKKPAPLEAAQPIATKPPDMPTEDWPEFGTPEFKAMAPERIRKWLESRGRDAASLVAAWDITGEESLLTEAAENFPNDPRVCLAMIAWLTPKDALPWIERLIAAEPQNPEGFYLKAWACRAMKDNAAALEAIRSAVTMNGERDSHIKDRMLTVREAALASGAGIRDAADLAIAAPCTHTPIHKALNGLMVIGTELKAAKAAGDTERMLELAGLGLAVAGKLNQTPDILDELVSSTLEKAVLSELPPDTEIGAAGTSAALQLEEFNARREELMKFLKQGNSFEAIRAAASDAEIAEYTDRHILYGERAAVEWLQQQAAPK
jgi:hypothetical protein